MKICLEHYNGETERRLTERVEKTNRAGKIMGIE